MAEKIRVVICSGTACYVMGASELFLLEDHLNKEQSDNTEIVGTNCLGLCKAAENPHHDKPPFVTVNGVLLSSATIPAVIEKIQEFLDA